MNSCGYVSAPAAKELCMPNDNTSDDRDIDSEARSAVSALASAVISVLSDRGDEANVNLRNQIVRKLVAAALREGAFSAERLLHDLMDEKIENSQIIDIYVPAAARELGQMWTDDAIGFAKVTIATARLQALLTLLAPPWAVQDHEPKKTINTLMVLQGNDSHTLGPHVATAQLRRMGSSVRLLFGPDDATLSKVLSQDTYDLILFSCSRTDALETIAKSIKRIRISDTDTPPIALGGIVLELTDRIKEKTGVDLVTNDVRVAVKLCERKRHKIKSVAR